MTKTALAYPEPDDPRSAYGRAVRADQSAFEARVNPQRIIPFYRGNGTQVGKANAQQGYNAEPPQSVSYQGRLFQSGIHRPEERVDANRWAK